jgi:hypothetical protein
VPHNDHLAVQRIITHSNTERLHSSLEYLRPVAEGLNTAIHFGHISKAIRAALTGRSANQPDGTIEQFSSPERHQRS